MAARYAIARNVTLLMFSSPRVLLTIVSFPQASTLALAPLQGGRCIGQRYTCLFDPNPVLTLLFCLYSEAFLVYE